MKMSKNPLNGDRPTYPQSALLPLTALVDVTRAPT